MPVALVSSAVARPTSRRGRRRGSPRGRPGAGRSSPRRRGSGRGPRRRRTGSGIPSRVPSAACWYASTIAYHASGSLGTGLPSPPLSTPAERETGRGRGVDRVLLDERQLADLLVVRHPGEEVVDARFDREGGVAVGLGGGAGGARGGGLDAFVDPGEGAVADGGVVGAAVQPASRTRASAAVKRALGRGIGRVYRRASCHRPKSGPTRSVQHPSPDPGGRADAGARHAERLPKWLLPAGLREGTRS